MHDMHPPEPVTPAADRVARALDADVIHLAGPLTPEAARSLADECRARRRRTHACLVLETPGGDLHAAYRIARCLQRRYARLTVHVPRRCAGAGVLVAVAAHALVMPDQGELGPLAVHTAGADAAGDGRPEVSPADALAHLAQCAGSVLAALVPAVREACGPDLPPRAVAETAADLAIGLLAPVARRLDPMLVAETAAARVVAASCGHRLLAHGANIDPEAFERLLSAWPSPECVIDREEAKRLFATVRAPTPDEARLAERLRPRAPDDARVAFVSSEPPAAEERPRCDGG